MKNKLIKIIAISSLIVPIFSISCSTTWITWKKSNDLEETTFEFKNKE